MSELKEVEPIEVWTSAMMDYSTEIVDDLRANAWSHLCRDGDGKLQPHVSVLYYDGRGVELFKTGKPDIGNWVMKVYVFRSNHEMDLWVDDFGSHRVLDICYSTK